MKPKKHAKDAREELAKLRKGQWSQGKADSIPAAGSVHVLSVTPDRKPAPVTAVYHDYAN